MNAFIQTVLSFILLAAGSIAPAESAPDRLPAVPAQDLSKLEDLVRQAEYGQALERAKALEAKYPRYRVHFMAQKALALMYLGMKQEAEAESKEVVKIDPKNYYGHWVLACLLAARGKSHESSIHYNLAVKNKPSAACNLCLKLEKDRELKSKN